MIPHLSVIPAKAGIAGGSCCASSLKAPAYAGATNKGVAE